MEAYGSYQFNLLVSFSQFPDCSNFANFHRFTSGRVAKQAVILVYGSDRRKHASSPERLVDSRPLRSPKSKHPMGTHAPSNNHIRGFEDMLEGHHPRHVYSDGAKCTKPGPHHNPHDIISSSDSFSTHVSHNGRLCRQFEQLNA